MRFLLAILFVTGAMPTFAIDLDGQIDFSQRLALNSSVSARVHRINVAVGQQVAPGELLLVLDNFDHLKAYWIMLGIGTAQAALAYGADDIDGTVRHELIYHDAGAETPEILSVEQIQRLIREAGREPIERDTLYRRVEREGDNWRAAEQLVAK